MDQERLNQLLHAVAIGKTSIEEASDLIKKLPYEDIDFAHIDHHRSLRKGFPEVIFGLGKTAPQIIGIMERMIPQESIILVTRVDGGNNRVQIATQNRRRLQKRTSRGITESPHLVAVGETRYGS